MGLGSQVRLRRMFNHSSGNLFGIAVDHFASYGGGITESGIGNLPQALDLLMKSGRDSIRINCAAVAFISAGRRGAYLHTANETPHQSWGRRTSQP